MQLSPHSTPVPLQYTKVNVLPSLERADPENRPFYICSGPWIPPPEATSFSTAAPSMKKMIPNSLYRRQNIGFVFQNYNLVPELTVQENILLPLMIDKKSVDKDYFQFILSTLALEDRLRHLPGELSGGQQQRAAIARAIIHKPPVLLCDEPTGNLDSKNSREVLDLLLDLTAQTQITLIVVTHDEKIAHAMDSILVIHDGHIRRELS